MNCYEARFGSTLCHVDVEARPSVRGGPVYVATPFILDEERGALHWFANAKGHQTELVHSSEEDVLRSASTAPFQPAPDRKSPFVISPPKRESN